ncbi:hypothetical protein KVP04_03310 [Halobacterium salinarum]|uniref:hypothetical protein n=1 Tax=Halobacterium salinarum TaxID=2242 RepID=UPI001F3750DE|nr:hypothetical protein [Halobacterium salinarum]MCF2238157.1 hypothetical protein [Halobacterium salinarum]
MSRWLPQDAVRSGIRNPTAIPKHIKRNVIDELRQQIRLGIATAALPNQADLLAELRRKDSFCLIVLDACRHDHLETLFPLFFEGRVKPTKTVATNTFEYLQYNWPETYAYPYVTAATPVTSETFEFDGQDSGDGLPQEDLYAYYRGYTPINHFTDLVEVWRDSWDSELRVCPPEPTTRRAIARADDAARMVVHYFQPHAPFIGERRPDLSRERSTIHDENVKIDEDVWDAVKSGSISTSELGQYYSSNLRRVLAAVSKLVSQTQFDRYVLIGDHGEALGEYGGFAHSMEHPLVNKVPWAEVETTKDGCPSMWEYDAPTEDETGTGTTRSRLKELGYIE